MYNIFFGKLVIDVIMVIIDIKKNIFKLIINYKLYNILINK